MTTEYVCCGYGHVANIGNASDINNIAVDCGKKQEQMFGLIPIKS